MLLLIIFVALMLVGIVMIILGNAYIKNYRYPFENLTGPGWITAILSGLVVLVMLIFTIDLKTNFAYQEDKYNNLKIQVEMCEHDDIVTDANLRNQVLDMNNNIAHHRQYSKNKWIGMYYSKHLGTLEPLQWKTDK